MNWNEEVSGIHDSWRRSRGKGIRVAVLDSGFTPQHPDFMGAFHAENIQDFANENGTGKDIVGHGTHCAGLIGARNFSPTGVVGVAPECELLLGKVQRDGRGFRSGPIAEGIAWARSLQADIVSMSFSTWDVDDQTLKDQIRGAVAEGIILVGAAGNNGELFEDTLLYPASADGVIAVGAVTDEILENKAGRAFNGKLDLVLPFQKFLSTWNGEPSLYHEEEGCSMATAIVAGLISLALSFRGTRVPLDELKSELRGIATKIDADFRFSRRTIMAYQ